MKDKFRKTVHLAVMDVALIAVVIFGVIHALTAIDSQYGILMLAGYVIMAIWAACRLAVLVKELRQ